MRLAIANSYPTSANGITVKYSVTYPFVLQVLMQFLYLIVLCTQCQGDESRREKTEYEIDHNQQTTDKLACRDLVTYGMNQPKFSFNACKDALTTNLSLRLKFLVQLHKGIIGKGHASKPEAR